MPARSPIASGSRAIALCPRSSIRSDASGRSRRARRSARCRPGSATRRRRGPTPSGTAEAAASSSSASPERSEPCMERCCHTRAVSRPSEPAVDHTAGARPTTRRASPRYWGRHRRADPLRHRSRLDRRRTAALPRVTDRRARRFTWPWTTARGSSGCRWLDRWSAGLTSMAHVGQVGTFLLPDGVAAASAAACGARRRRSPRPPAIASWSSRCAARTPRRRASTAASGSSPAGACRARSIIDGIEDDEVLIEYFVRPSCYFRSGGPSTGVVSLTRIR